MKADNPIDFKLAKKIVDSNTYLEENKILCTHCMRTKTNNISCMGKCVSDNEY